MSANYGRTIFPLDVNSTVNTQTHDNFFIKKIQENIALVLSLHLFIEKKKTKKNRINIEFPMLY